jgi:predicted dinucleotide-binding enzyme
MGSVLARRLATLGHQVRIANSRGPESRSALAAETGVTASTVEHAARARDIVIVTIPQFDALDAGSLAESWRQQPGSPAYCADLDRTALQAALSKPDAAGIASRRHAANEQARPFFEARQ